MSPKLNFRLFLYVVFSASFFAGTVAVTYIVLTVKNKVFATQVKNQTQTYPSIPQVPTDPNKLTFLLLGHGGEGHEGGELVDSIIFVKLLVDKKEALWVTVPRDTWVEGRKVNQGMLDGGFDLLRHEIQVITGTLPENYVSIDFGGFKKAIDILGGIDVGVVHRYEDKYYPIKGKELDTCGMTADEFAKVHELYSGYQLEIQFECRYEHLKFEPGVNHMDGETALKYVRSRHGDSDFGRSERQLLVLDAIKNKVIGAGLVRDANVFNEITKIVRTNMDLLQLRGVIDFLGDPSLYKVTRIRLTDENVFNDAKNAKGQFILIPKAGVDKFTQVVNYISSND